MSIYLCNADVYRAQGEFVPGATLVITGGKISRIGKIVPPASAKRAEWGLLHDAYQAWLAGPITPAGKRPTPPDLGDIAIDCSGLRIYPGLLDPHTHICVLRGRRGAGRLPRQRVHRPEHRAPEYQGQHLSLRPGGARRRGRRGDLRRASFPAAPT